MKIFRILTTPSCWFRLGYTNKHLDKWLQEALKNPQFSCATELTVILNGKKFWIGNYPYAYAYPYNKERLGLPSRSTVFRFADALSKFEFDGL